MGCLRRPAARLAGGMRNDETPNEERSPKPEVRTPKSEPRLLRRSSFSFTSFTPAFVFIGVHSSFHQKPVAGVLCCARLGRKPFDGSRDEIP